MTVAMGEVSDEEHVTGARLGLVVGTLPDAVVRRAIGVIDASGIVERIAAAERARRRGPGGRPRTFPLRALLVGLLVVATRDDALHLTTVCHVLFQEISATMRRELGVPDPPPPDDVLGQEAVYRNVRTRFHALIDLMDPSDTPKNRRLDHHVFEDLCAQRRAQRSDADRAEAAALLTWVVNQLIEASLQLLPRAHRRAMRGSLAVDATPVPAFARGEVKPLDASGERHVVRHSADPDAGWYARTTDARDGGPPVTKSNWAYEATLAVSGDVEHDDADRLPSLVLGMAILHAPGAEPGRNGIRALSSVAERGYSPGYLAADRAYSSAKAEDFQLPARALGWKPVFDYKADQLGIQAQAHGLVQVEGSWYCPAMPKALIDATGDWRAGRIDEATYATRIAARQAYAARPKASADAEGHRRYLCPASGSAPTARCVLKPASEGFDGTTRLRIRPAADLATHPPAICRQQSVTVAPEQGAKFAQELPYASGEHRRIYATLRNSIEGMNGYLKDPAFEALGQAGRRRIRGVAAQSVLVAFQIFAANVRKIDGFLAGVAGASAGALRRRRPRRRTTAPLATWRPEPVPPPTPPDTAGRPPPGG